MRTIDDIISDLEARAAAGQDVRQQLVSYRAIREFSGKLAAAEQAGDGDRIRGLRQQIGMHLRMVDEQPTADALAAAAPAGTAPAKPAKASPK